MHDPENRTPNNENIDQCKIEILHSKKEWRPEKITHYVYHNRNQ
jgi:hypothetical protein